MKRALQILAFVAPSLAVAAPPVALDDVLGPPTVAPTDRELVPLNPPEPLPAGVRPEALASDPEALVRFVAANPERLDVKQMDPALVLTLVQVLLRGDRTFLAEKLLHDAHRQWPERVDLARGWARVLISLGRPDAAIPVLEDAQGKAPGDPVVRYLLGRACLGSQPNTPEKDACARKAFEAVIELNPQYTDPDGVRAQDLMGIIQKLSANR
ncbi:MAG: tetratricopeptide repeat protein [Myxococcales bacterium]|nr:tetratricopeptide repeat protein [Myxococcales bacterium]